MAKASARHILVETEQACQELKDKIIKEFDTVVFNDEVGKVHGPVQTQFGYHLIEITARD